MPKQNSTIDKLPPQDVEAEKSLLGCLMIDPEAIYKVADFLMPRDFYKESHLQIYEAMLGLFEKREPIDFLSVSSKLKSKEQLEQIGGAGYLTELINIVPTASHIATYAHIVQQKRVLRELISAGHEIQELAYNESQDTDELLDRVEKKIFSIAQRSLTQAFTQVKDSLEETWQRIDELSKQKGALRGIPTGFKGLDNLLAGLQKSDLIILAARPSLGKSSLAVDMARNVSMNHKIPVGIFSLEMSKDQIIDRLLAAEANIDLWRLRTGRLSDQGEDSDFSRIQKAMAALSEAPLYINDIASIDILQMRAMSRRLSADKGLGLIIVDYLQLMEHRNPQMSLVQQVTENTRALKGLAKELNVPVLVLSQLSRAVEQRTPQVPRLSDLRDSGCLTGDTLITRADTGARIPIKDLVGEKNIPVHSLDFDWKIKQKKILKVFCSGKKMVYKLKTRSGFSIKASSNHPFWKISGWTRLDKLKIGDKIATPEKIKISQPKNKLSDDEIILLAHLLGDGCVLPRQPFHYTSADWQNIQIVTKTAKKLFKIEPRIVRQKNWWHIYLPSPYPLARGTYHPITKWYDSLNLKRVHSWNKQIPEAIFQCDNKKIVLFLKHLWSTDGNISKKILRGRQPSVNIYYATTSKNLAKNLKSLLLRVGIRSSIGEVRKDNYRVCYHIKIQGKQHQLNFLRNIGAFGARGENISQFIKYLDRIETNTNLDVWPKETWRFIIQPIKEKASVSWREFSAGINAAHSGTGLFSSGIGAERMQRIASFLESPILSNMASSDIFWDEIISIEPFGVEKVYDATVPGTYNFVANDIVVHNSIEQDADVVAFIYREDRYKENTERKNIADIIVAKHRNGPVGKVELYFDEQRVTFRDIEKHYEQ